jgi:hypothetical protein
MDELGRCNYTSEERENTPSYYWIKHQVKEPEV